MKIEIPQFLALREKLPMVDVRSESEFQSGHIPLAINIPLLTNSERVVVGTAYKQEGQARAIKEGFRLVGPRLVDIVENAQAVGNEFIVHCWRGGMRSGNFCQFVGMSGVKTHQLIGGYKAYRQYASNFFEKDYFFHVISGYTGSGKTDILKALREAGEQVVDLESLAHHKGSAFGGLGQLPQPTTEQFQNDLFEELYRLDATKRIWIEDESIAVGKIFLPMPFWKTMGASPIVLVDVSKEERIKRLVAEYGEVDREGFAIAMKAITKKLGGQNYQAALEQLKLNNMSSVIDIILTYYDKAYANGIERKENQVKVRTPWDGSSINSFVTELIHDVDRRQLLARQESRSR